MHLRPGLTAAVLSLLICPQAALSERAAAPVVVAPVAETEISEVLQLTGTVTALRDAQLSVATPGLVTALHVDAGDHVNQGDPLLEMDGELARLQYEAARATQEQSARALADAQRRLAEARSLAPKQSIAETVVKDIAAEAAEDEAALQRARAETGYRKGVLDRHRLSAPFAGVIRERAVELGEWVAPGRPILSLVSTQELRLDFQVPEDYLARVRAGQAMRFSLGAERQQLYAGSVSTTVPVTDPTVRTFLARVEAAEPVPGMLPGMSAQGELRLDTGRVGITVPRDAILRYNDGRLVVWVTEESGGEIIAAERLVKVGASFDGRVEILSGLAQGDRVVVKGNESLRSGQALEIRAGGGG